MRSKKTTLSGVLAAAGYALSQLDVQALDQLAAAIGTSPEQVGGVATGTGLLLMAIFARDDDVTSEGGKIPHKVR